MATQGLLFSEPSIAETCVWCELSEGIDPAEWAMLCRYIGTLSPKEFQQVEERLMPSPDTMTSKHCHHTDNLVGIPLVSIGPSGIGGQYQQETMG